MGCRHALPLHPTWIIFFELCETNVHIVSCIARDHLPGITLLLLHKLERTAAEQQHTIRFLNKARALSSFFHGSFPLSHSHSLSFCQSPSLLLGEAQVQLLDQLRGISADLRRADTHDGPSRVRALVAIEGRVPDPADRLCLAVYPPASSLQPPRRVVAELALQCATCHSNYMQRESLCLTQAITTFAPVSRMVPGN